MNGVPQAVPETKELFHIYRDSKNSEYSARVRKALAASVALHLAAVVLLQQLDALGNLSKPVAIVPGELDEG